VLSCISIFSASRGFLDDIPVPAVSKFEDGLLSYFRAQKADLRAKLATSKSFKGIEDQFLAAVKAFKAAFRAN
jgi:F-type H+-transporting ATPase subunit alpha